MPAASPVSLRFGRIAIAAIVAEVIGVLALVVLVSIFGPSGGFAAAQPFAERLGSWVGPISGFLLCLLGGYWVARGAAPSYIQNGVGVGLAGAALDIGTAIALGAQFAPLLVFSNVGRVVGGTIGGWLAAGSSPWRPHRRGTP